MNTFFDDLDEIASPKGKVENSFFSDLPKEEISRTRSIISAPVKGALKGIKDIASTAMTLKGTSPFRGQMKRQLEQETEALIEKGLPTRPEFIEKSLERTGRMLPTPSTAIPAIAGGLAGQFAENQAFGPGGQTIAEIGGALLTPTKLPTFLASQEKKLANKWAVLDIAAKGNPQKEALLDFALKHSLTPEEATLLQQSRGKINTLEKLAHKSKKYRTTVQDLKTKLGQNYDELKRLGNEKGFLRTRERENLVKNLEDVSREMEKTFYESPELSQAKKAIGKTIENFRERSGTIEDLINTRQQLRRDINWNAFDSGDKYREMANDALLNAITKKDPRIGDRLYWTDKAWRQYERLKPSKKAKEAAFTFKGIPIPDWASNLAFYASIPMYAAFPKTAGLIVSAGLVQRLSTRLLSNPKYQAMHKRLVKSLLEGSKKKQGLIWQEFKGALKNDDPKLYEEIEDISYD